jgi:hypothetical protein
MLLHHKNQIRLGLFWLAILGSSLGLGRDFEIAFFAVFLQ